MLRSLSTRFRPSNLTKSQDVQIQPAHLGFDIRKFLLIFQVTMLIVWLYTLNLSLLFRYFPIIDNLYPLPPSSISVKVSNPIFILSGENFQTITKQEIIFINLCYPDLVFIIVLILNDFCISDKYLTKSFISSLSHG